MIHLFQASRAVEDFAAVEILGKWQENCLHFAHCRVGAALRRTHAHAGNTPCACARACACVRVCVVT